VTAARTAASSESTGPGRGKSGLRRAGCWLTASRGDPQESATENRPPMASRLRVAQVRVKRCGKSAPASGATRVARQTPLGARPSRGRAARSIPQVGRIDGWSPIRSSARTRRTEPRLQAGSLRITVLTCDFTSRRRSLRVLGAHLAHMPEQEHGPKRPPDLDVVPKPVDVGSAHRLHRVAQVPGDGRQGRALGQARSAEVAQ